jgi:hypothetical protein
MLSSEAMHSKQWNWRVSGDCEREKRGCGGCCDVEGGRRVRFAGLVERGPRRDWRATSKKWALEP